MKKIYLFNLLFISCLLANAQLGPGDIMFTGYQSDTPDTFSFVVLVDVPALTPIEFTDNGWQAAGGFRLGEGIGSWVSPNTELSAGTEVIISGLSATEGSISANNMALSTSGDQLFAYNPANIPIAGDDSGFYAGIQMNGDWDADSTTANTSVQPSTLNGFSLAIAPEVDNATYNCSTVVGTKSELVAALINPANWNTSNTIVTMPDCNWDPVLSNNSFDIDEFLLFPNPTSTGFVTIKSASNAFINVAVFDVLGKQVINQTLSNDRLNVSSLNAGVYVMRISQDNSTSTKKLVIR